MRSGGGYIHPVSDSGMRQPVQRFRTTFGIEIITLHICVFYQAILISSVN